MPETLFDREPELKTTAVASWFGSNRRLAAEVGKELRGCKWVGVPFAGGMSELACIKATTIVVGDLHRHVINLAKCIQSDELRPILVQRLSDQPFHDDVLAEAQALCRKIEPHEIPSLDLAVAYFTACWMNRSGKAGIDDEFNGRIAVRWNAHGGDSNKRYRSSILSLSAWGEIMQRCNFYVGNAFEFLEKTQDEPDHGFYVDAPWPDDGDRYKHGFTRADQRRLATKLATFSKARVVVRYGDHPLIRELYPELRWRWRRLTGRTQANNAKAEVLIINGPSSAKETA